MYTSGCGIEQLECDCEESGNFPCKESKTSKFKRNETVPKKALVQVKQIHILTHRC